MHLLSHPWLVGIGIVLLIIGFWLWRWAGRHDLKGLAVDAAWQVAKARGDLSARSDLRDKLADLKADGSNVSRAKKAAGYAGRHVLAQIASLAGLVSMLGGVGLIGLAAYLK